MQPESLVIRTTDGRPFRICALLGYTATLRRPGGPPDSPETSDLIDNLREIVDAYPPTTTKTPLSERRSNLISNISRMRNATDSQAVKFIAMLLMRGLTGGRRMNKEHIPFWESVAESTDDPRQVSWSEQVRAIDNDPHRKRGRWAVFLKKAVEYGLGENGDMLSDEEVNLFGGAVGRLFPRDYNLSYEIVRGQAVLDAYNDPRGPTSCMKGRPYTELYAANPDKVGLVKLLRGGEYFGRALLWTLDEPEGRTFLDRIYPSDGGDHIEWLQGVARGNGWLYKTRQSWGDYFSEAVVMQVGLDTGNVERFPYLDSLTYATQTEGAVSLCSAEGLHFGQEHDVELTRTDGAWPAGVWSSWEDAYVDPEDCTWVECVESYVYNRRLNDNFTRVGDDYYRVEDCVYSCYCDRDLLRDEAAWLGRRGDWAPDADVATCDYTGTECVVEDLVETYEGRQCLEAEAAQLEDGAYAWECDPALRDRARDGRWYLASQLEDDEDKDQAESPAEETLMARSVLKEAA